MNTILSKSVISGTNSSTHSYLTDKAVSLKYSVSRATLWRWVQLGDFPKPVKLSKGCTRWKLEDIEAWEKEKAEGG